jgi:predicted metalloprotease with PDZ domain
MITYFISAPDRHRQFLHLSAEFPVNHQDVFHLQLPAWRPGRYELGNFAKNIRAFDVVDASGKPLSFVKETKDLWRVDTRGVSTLVVSYQFYADSLNAGSTWVDDEQVYINPINCFFYNPADPDAQFRLEFDLPKDYTIACGMPVVENHVLSAVGVQHLMDCPIMASASLTHWTYTSNNCLFHIWIQGEHQGIKELFIKDHQLFTDSQITAFGDIPCEEYHFMYHFPAFAVRHGVEHQNSTVIAMGPASRLTEEDWYRELIGISCHELYHTWNIKSIRPSEMMPYDFSRENYSRLGYVAEGVTTYFGDQFLHRCGVFDDEEYFSRLATTIERHLNNPGRFNMSVADSSFDTWIDGYQPGIPWRKVSIYNEGLLFAFICDVAILKATNGKKSLDDAMLLMYKRFGKSGKGYNENDYQTILEEVSGVNFTQLFGRYIRGTEDYMPAIGEALVDVGLQLEELLNESPLSAHLGFLVDTKGKITLVMPNSPADKAGLWFDDQIIQVNGRAFGEYDRSLVMASSLVSLEINRHNKVKNLTIQATDEPWLNRIRLSRNDDDAPTFYSSWKRM